jgi:hypothetical protein
MDTLVAEIPEDAGEFLGLSEQHGQIILECEHKSYRLDPETGALIEFSLMATQATLQ